MRSKTPLRYDLIIVGGGPAGSAAAFTAATHGVRTCLIDKSQFPREKLCGGLVTQRSKAVFESVFRQTWDHRLFTKSDQISFYWNNKLLAKNDGYSLLYFTMRKAFDAYLLGLAETTNADIRTNTEIVDIDVHARRVSLLSGEVLEFEYLIGADGVNSQVAKSLFGASFDNDTIGFGLEVEIPRSQAWDSSDRVEIDFGAASWGYGWIFPKHETLTVGVGGIHRLNPDLKASLARYLSYKGLDIRRFRVKGQYIPFGDFRKIPGNENILLCGDAAGVVDPISGEGIAYAMETGAAAARAVSECIKKRPHRASALAAYGQYYNTITTTLRQARSWRYLIFPRITQKPFAWAFADATTLQNGYLDILAGKHSYNALYGLFLLQVAKALRKGLLYLPRKFLRKLR
jgi:geranylgeranyl reductase family protein